MRKDIFPIRGYIRHLRGAENIVVEEVWLGSVELLSVYVRHIADHGKEPDDLIGIRRDEHRVAKLASVHEDA